MDGGSTIDPQLYLPPSLVIASKTTLKSPCFPCAFKIWPWRRGPGVGMEGGGWRWRSSFLLADNSMSESQKCDDDAELKRDSGPLHTRAKSCDHGNAVTVVYMKCPKAVPRYLQNHGNRRSSLVWRVLCDEPLNQNAISRRFYSHGSTHMIKCNESTEDNGLLVLC